jgi:hypothetical protein
LGLAATFVAPNPVERMLCPFQAELRHPVQRIITEMQPLWRTAVTPPFAGMPVYLLAGVIGLTVVLRLRHYRFWEVALLAGLGVLANQAVRSVQDWVLMMLALGVPHVAVLLAQAARQGRQRAWIAVLLRVDASCKRLFYSPALRPEWFWPGLVLGLLAVVSLTPPLGRRVPVQEARRYPSAAVNWIEQNGLPTPGPWRVFGPPDYGAYLVWRLGDRVRCYADTRTFCYPPELIEDSHYVPLLADGWRERLENILAGQTEYLLLETNRGRGSLWQTLRPWVSPLYLDGESVLLSSLEARRGLAAMEESLATDHEDKCR